jgi:pyridoxamine 5'-phosphate oxidase
MDTSMLPTPDELRHQWMSMGLSHEALDADPFRQFELWYTQAIDSGIAEANALSLATVDAGGQPSIRTMLLKLYDTQGFVFFTNYDTPNDCAIVPVGVFA